MKNIPEPDLSDVIFLTPAELNKIHFGGNHTPLTPDKLKALGYKDSSTGSSKPQATDH